MLRILGALTAVSAFAATAGAQPRALPLSPGIQPDRSLAPMPAGIGAVTVRPGQPGIVYFPAISPWGWATGWGYRSPFGFGYTFGGYLPYGFVLPVPQPAAVEPPPKPERMIALANEFPATLSLQFPAAATVWLNGQPVKGDASEDRVLTSPVLKPGDTFTFEVKARWKQRGTEYESVRTVTLGPGERSRLFVVSGNEVK